MSAVRATRAALPVMQARGSGSIVNVSSTSGEATLRGHARLLGHEGGAALVLAPRRGRLREGRDPLQRGHARADGHRARGSERAGSPTSRDDGKRCSRRSGPAARSAGSPSPRRSPPCRLPLLRTGLVRHGRRLVAPTAAPSRSSSERSPRRGYRWLDDRADGNQWRETPSRRACASCEESALSPLAVRSYETRGRARARGGVPRPDAVPARPRPHPPLEAVPPAEGEDAGLHRPGRRPLPHAHDAHARDDRHRPSRRARAPAERGPDRGDRARPRHGPSAVRARGRGGARRAAARVGPASATTSSPRASRSG